MERYRKSEEVFAKNRDFISGGVVSINRAILPGSVFVIGEGAYIWDADGNRYIDYHTAFAPYFPGHNDPCVSDAVIRVLRERAGLYGSGATILDGRLAELIWRHIP